MTEPLGDHWVGMPVRLRLPGMHYAATWEILAISNVGVYVGVRDASGLVRWQGVGGVTYMSFRALEVARRDAG